MLYIFRNQKTIIIFALTLILIPFVWFCYQIYQKHHPEFDNWFISILGDRNNIFLNTILKIVYAIGGVYIAGGIVAISLGILIWRAYWQKAAALSVATAGILILVDEILKPLFGRRRPPKPRLVEDLSRDSFPSGHAAGNLVLYFYLSFILAVKYPKLKLYIYSLATIIVFLIGLASIYTKAHWLSDILAGYLFGYLWLLVSLNFLNYLQNKYKQ